MPNYDTWGQDEEDPDMLVSFFWHRRMQPFHQVSHMVKRKPWWKWRKENNIERLSNVPAFRPSYRNGRSSSVPAVQTGVVQNTVLNFSWEKSLHGKEIYVWGFFTRHLHELKGRFIGKTVAILHIRYCSNWTCAEQEEGLDGLWWSLLILHTILWTHASAIFSEQKLKIFTGNTALFIVARFILQCSWYGPDLKAINYHYVQITY